MVLESIRARVSPDDGVGGGDYDDEYGMIPMI